MSRRLGKQLATIVEPALPFVGHAATSAAAFSVGMGVSQVPPSIRLLRVPPDFRNHASWPAVPCDRAVQGYCELKQGIARSLARVSDSLEQDRIQ